jgi:hypothetical protein
MKDVAIFNRYGWMEGHIQGWLLRYEIMKISPLRNHQFLLFLSLTLILMGAW